MQIPILSGVYTDEDSDIRTSYPKNLIPVPKDTDISKGYLRPAPGIVNFGTGPGLDRGGINWNDVCYRVMGTSLVSIDANGAYTTIGDVGGSTQVTLDYSFDYLGAASAGNFYLYDGTTLTQVTDTDLGTVIDFIFIDGYFMTTDGEFLVVTELNDPFSVNPLKYGSSEVDPDPIKAILKLNNEAVALNRYTIETFNNRQTTDLFPFIRVDGAQINKGAVGTHACCVFLETITFLGGGRNEAVAIWSGVNGRAVKISTNEIDQVLSEYTETQLSTVSLEVRTYNSHEQLYVHLPERTLVYDGTASQVTQVSVWFTLTSSTAGLSQYKAKNMVYCYDKWLVGDPTSTSHGYYTDSISSHYGSVIGMEFNTPMTYNEGRGAIFHELELVCLSGRASLGIDPTVWTQYSLDGETWSMEKSVSAGKQGERNKRIVWFQQGAMRHWRTQRFRFNSNAHLSVVRLEARVEPLND